MPSDAAMQEEIFGPVAPISRFEQDSEAIERANDTECGLAAYIYTRELARGMRVAARIEAGMIALNRDLCRIRPRRLAASSRAALDAKAGKGMASPSSWRRNISPSDVDGRHVRRDPFNRDHAAPWVKKQDRDGVQSRQAQAPRGQDRGD